MLEYILLLLVIYDLEQGNNTGDKKFHIVDHTQAKVYMKTLEKVTENPIVSSGK